MINRISLKIFGCILDSFIGFTLYLKLSTSLLLFRDIFLGAIQQRHFCHRSSFVLVFFLSSNPPVVGFTDHDSVAPSSITGFFASMDGFCVPSCALCFDGSLDAWIILFLILSCQTIMAFSLVVFSRRLESPHRHLCLEVPRLDKLEIYLDRLSTTHLHKSWTKVPRFLFPLEARSLFPFSFSILFFKKREFDITQNSFKIISLT